jgi:CBS domain-containing protein
MSIGKIAKNNVVTIKENASIQEAASIMKKENVGSLIVVKDGTDGSNPIGIITDRDIVVHIIAKDGGDLSQAKVADAMNTDLLKLSSNEDVQSAIEAMSNQGVRRAIISDDDTICGIVSIDDLIIKFANVFNNLGNLIQQQIR